jgi:penicillin-binding protein-related factor A (putative recombinase)
MAFAFKRKTTDNRNGFRVQTQNRRQLKWLSRSNAKPPTTEMAFAFKRETADN